MHSEETLHSGDSPHSGELNQSHQPYRPNYFLGGFVVPHPPVIVPAVGNGREHDARQTCDALDLLAKRLADLKPETVVLVSPHAPVFRDYVFFYEPLQSEATLSGALRQFGDSTEQRYEWDKQLQEAILSELSGMGIEAGSLSPEIMRRHKLESSLDHGALVPLHFLSKPDHDFKLVVLASPGIDLQQVHAIGRTIRDAAEKLGRRTLLVASGDLSHKVNAESPYGSCPEGKRFDLLVTDLLGKGDLAGVFSIDHSLREKAAECGFRSIVTLCGALEGLPVKSELLSYEAPFGIGYGVVSLLVNPAGNEERKEERDEACHEESSDTKTNRKGGMSSKKPGSSHVELAKAALEARIRHHKILDVQTAAPAEELLHARGGVFVSLHKFGELRGCIGTIGPTTDSLAEEIIQNAISAATGDPRFKPVAVEELSYLTVHVDVLNPAEPARKQDLDPKKYGIIVEKSRNRGLLLPDLEGVDTVEQQLNIACRKGGIDPEGTYQISRFTVTRYES